MRTLIICVLLLCSVVVEAQEQPTFDICTIKFGEVVRAHTDLPSTLKAWEQHKSYCPKDGSYEYYVCAIYEGFGKDQEAVAFLQQESAKYKHPPRRLFLALAGALHTQTNNIQSIQIAKQLIKDHPNWYGGYWLMGIYTSEQGDHQKAREYYEIVINDKEEGQTAFNYMCLLEENYLLHDYTKAAIAFYKAEQLDMKVVIGSRQLSCYGAISYIKIKEYKNAKIALTRQAKYDPDSTALPIYKEAVRLYEEATGEKL